jgi:hypothetical protein
LVYFLEIGRLRIYCQKNEKKISGYNIQYIDKCHYKIQEQKKKFWYGTLAYTGPF